MYTIFMYTIHNIQYIKLSTTNYYLYTINLWISMLISICNSVFPTLLKVIHNFFLPYMAIIILPIIVKTLTLYTINFT